MESPSSTENMQRALSTLRQQLQKLSPKARMEALLEGPHAAALVRALPAEELYVTISEVGLADATELVQLVSPRQFCTFVDLAGWKKDELAPHEVLNWLRAARGEDAQPFLSKLRGLDLEVLEILLRKFTTVHDLEENPDVNPAGVTMETPEGRYLVEFALEGAELAGLRSLITDLIAENPFEAVRLFEAVRWEVLPELEETAYQFRSARLADLGFPPLEEAVQLFTFVRPTPLEQTPATSAAALVARQGHVDYFEAAVRGLDAVELENLEVELRGVANAALVAEGADPGDLDAIRRVGELTRDGLSLGIEHLTGARPERASDAVRGTPLKQVFQTGFSLTLQLKFQAERLTRAPFSSLQGALLLFEEEARAVAELLKKRPRRALKVEGAESVAFRSLKDLALSEALLARAEEQLQLLRDLLGGDEARALQTLAPFAQTLPHLGVSPFFASAVAVALLDGKVGPRPLPPARVAELGALLFEGSAREPQLRAGVAEKALTILAPAVSPTAHPELKRLVQKTLELLRDELGSAYLSEGGWDLEASEVLPFEGSVAQ